MIARPIKTQLGSRFGASSAQELLEVGVLQEPEIPGVSMAVEAQVAFRTRLFFRQALRSQTTTR